MLRQDQKHLFGINRWDLAVAASFLLLVAALGCGKEEKRVSATIEAPRGATAGIAQSASTALPADGANTAVVGGVAESGGGASETTLLPEASGEDGALPPEVAVSTTDSLAVPGSIVEITAEASGDVVTMVLSDGKGQSRPFAYDSAANVWRTTYRVPMRSATERLGLSVTATNGENRWKRVWVFLNLLPKQTTASAESGSGC
jgi:hypothetical protein